MTSIEGSSSGLVDDHAPPWKFITKLEKIERGEEIESENVVIVLNHSMDLILKSQLLSGCNIVINLWYFIVCARVDWYFS